MSGAPGSLVLRASAGTGKTYRLSQRFIALLAGGADPESILASTFTRKAAGEILGSVLGRLARCAASPEEATTLAQEIELPAGWSTAEAGALLDDLLDALPRLRIQTLDSWFQAQVDRAALRLGLPPAWRLAEEVDLQAARREALEACLETLPDDEALTLLAAMQAGRSKRSLLESGGQLLREAEALVRGTVGHDQAWELLDVQRPPREAWAAAAEALDQVKPPLTKSGTPAKRWLATLTKLREAVADQDVDAAAGNSLLAKVLAGEVQFDRHPIPIALMRPAAELVARTLLVELHEANLALRRVATREVEALDAILARDGLLDHDDFPRRLAACPFPLREELMRAAGRRVQHLLLDEFQDTSVLQWQALAPLAEASTGDGRSLFVVGDGKQSIYGFREGEPRLLASLAAWLDLGEETMARNYRSAPAILDAVNLTFAGLPGRFDPETEPVLATAAAAWEDFPPHEAEHADRKGGVRLWQVHGPRSTDTLALHQATLARALALHREQPKARLAILVRSNRVIPRLLAELVAHGVPAVGAGGNPLTDAHAVEAALALFQLADHPGDTAAWFLAAESTLGELLGYRFRPGTDMVEDARRASRDLRRRLLHEGYGPFLESLARGLATHPEVDAFDRRRFARLVELGLAWDERAGLRPADFVAMVRERRVAEPGVAAVQVMTIHQAKGLAFDLVLLPVPADSGSRASLFSVREDPRGPLTAAGRRPSALLEDAARLLGQERLLAAMDAVAVTEVQDLLCLLYVGMTRACTHMEILLPPRAQNPRDNPRRLRADDFFRRTILTHPSPVAVPEVADPGRERWWAPLWQDHPLPEDMDPTSPLPPTPKAATDEEQESLPRLTFAAGTASRHLPRTSPTATEEEAVRGKHFLRANDGAAMRRGDAMHRLLALVAFLPELPPLEAQAEALAAMEPPPSAEEREAWLADFAAMLARPELAAALTTPEGTEAPELWRERPFALRITEGGEPAVLQGVYDRVHVERRDGKALAATILDFKTGEPPADGTMPEAYRRQLETYRMGLAIQTGLAPEAIEAALLYLDADQRLALGPA
jgi:ATP-dependent helicase/nuclease subunit A